jgi:hypothetical protein
MAESVRARAADSVVPCSNLARGQIHAFCECLKVSLFCNTALNLHYLAPLNSSVFAGDLPAHGQQREGADCGEGRVPRGPRRLSKVVEDEELSRTGRPRAAHDSHGGVRRKGRWGRSHAAAAAATAAAASAAAPPAAAGEQGEKGRVQILLNEGGEYER